MTNMRKLPEFADLQPFTIEGLKRRQTNIGKIIIKGEIASTQRSSSYYMEYPSGGLTITGVIGIPHTSLLNPVVILNHGYVPPANYKSGEKTAGISEHLTNNGYITISPDFRGWGGSDFGDNFFRAGLVLDTLNLIDLIPSIETADPTRIGIWGHSMGAGTAVKSLVIDSRIKACVLYAPLSINDKDIFSRWGYVDVEMEKRNDELLTIYKKALENLDFLALTSPNQYLELVSAAVQIHTGLKDNVAPPEWADEIYKTLKLHNKEVEIFKYPDQGHYFSDSDLITMFSRSKVFFDHHV